MTTAATGNVSFEAVVPNTGAAFTATATDVNSNTSEFSTCVLPGASTERTWISNANGFWEDPDNWSGGIVPRDGDTVIIDRPTANPIVTVQSAVVALASLRSEEPLVVTGGTLTFDGPAELNGGLTQSGGSLGGAGNLTLDGTSLWTGGFVLGSGAMTVRNGASLTVNTPAANGLLFRSITNEGQLVWNQAGLVLNDGVQIVNQPSGVFEIQSNLVITGGGITNLGTLLKSGPAGTLLLSGTTFATSGTLQIRLGTVSDAIVSDRTGLLSGGTLDVRLSPGFTPTNGQLFDVLSFGIRVGAFGTVNGNGQTYTPSYTATGLTLIVGSGGDADLSIDMFDSPDPATRGNPLLYGLTVSNNGPGTAASVTVTDTLPGSVTFVSASPSQGSCSGTTTVVCSLGVLASGTSATIVIVVTPTAIGAISNTATVATISSDPVTGNNTAVQGTTVVNPPVTFIVTTTANSGPGSLRQAILDANGNVSAVDTIHFNIPGTGVHTIEPTGILPVITEAVTIDATTQPGYAGTPLIELDGTSAGATANGLSIVDHLGTTVRGLAINRFSGAGISVQNGLSHIFQNNFIGTNPAGTSALPNQDGIIIGGTSTNNVIGGSTDTGNVISGNSRSGVTLNGGNTTATLVGGNLIGTNRTGTASVGNGDGVIVSGSPSNIIGASARNVISGNQLSGITITGNAARFNVVGNNIIGADAAGAAPIGNGTHGVVVTLDAGENFIGGLGGVSANTIAFNTQAGVRVISGTGNTIRGNTIFQNGLLGIDLDAAAITDNDPGDADVGANDLQNFPVLAPVAGGVQATINTQPFTLAQIEFFSNSSCDVSGNGEGQNLLGTVLVTTDVFGNAVIPFFAAAVDQFVTATATDGIGNTSEFSACVQVPRAITISLPDNLPIGVGRSVTATVTLSQPAPAGGAVVTVTSAAPTIASVTAPGTTTIPQGTSTGQVTVNGVSAGGTILHANATGYVEGTLSVSVTQNLISTPGTLNVALGQTTAMPVSIGPSPAPAGGLTLDVISANASVVEVLTPQITVPEGALSANATVRGASPGSANVTVTNPDYSPSTTLVTSSAELNIIQSSASFNNGLPGPNLTLRLEHSGTPLAAQSNLAVTLSSADAACVTVLSSVTIATGLVSTTFQPSYGGTAALPCTVTVTASASGFTPDTVSITVNQRAGITMPGPATVGVGLQMLTGATLGAPAHGGVRVTVTSNDPTKVLVSSGLTTPGATSAFVDVPDGETIVSYFVQGVETTTDAITVTVSAPGFDGGSHAAQVVTSGVEIQNLNPAPTTLSADDTNWYVQVGVPCPGNAGLCQVQNVRAGGPPFVVTLTVANDVPGPPVAQLKSDQPAATGLSVTKPIQPGIYLPQAVPGGISPFGLALDPLAQGAGKVTVTGPAGVLTMTANGIRPFTVSGPGITMPGPATVGVGLQVLTGATLGASAHGGVRVTVTSNDPTRVLVSSGLTTPGTTSAFVDVPDGETIVNYFVQGVETTTDAITVTVSAPGFGSASHAVQVLTSGVELQNLNPAPTTLSADDTNWYVQVGVPCPGNAGLCQVQNVRAGGPPFVVTLTVANDVPGPPVAQLKSDQPAATGLSVTKPIQPGIYLPQAVPGGISPFGLALDPLAQGAGKVTVTGPAGVLTMTANGIRPFTVSGPGIAMPGPATVGARLQVLTGATLGASAHGGVRVTVTSNDPTRVLVSSGLTTPGTTSAFVDVPDGETIVNYFVQGVETVTGGTTVTVSAPGFGSASHAVQVVTSGLEIQNLSSQITNLSADDTNWYVQVGIPCLGNEFLCEIQNVRAGGPLYLVTLTNDVNGALVAQLKSDQPAAIGQSVTKPIQPGIYLTQAVPGGISPFGLALDPLANGTTSVTVSGPTGVLTMTTSGHRTVAVNTPRIDAPSAMTVGAGLQVFQQASLNGAQHGGVTVTITSSAPSAVFVSTDGIAAGSASIQVPVPNNSTSVPFFVQGLENVTGTATLTLSAPGFTSATMTVTVVPSAIEIQSLPPTLQASDPDAMSWYVWVGLPCPGNGLLCQVQVVRSGSPGFVVTLSHTSAAVANLKSDEPTATGQTVTKPIQPGSYFTLGVTGGISPFGLAFDPLVSGMTTVTASGPAGVIATTQASRTVVITP